MDEILPIHDLRDETKNDLARQLHQRFKRTVDGAVASLPDSIDQQMIIAALRLSWLRCLDCIQAAEYSLEPETAAPERGIPEQSRLVSSSPWAHQ